MDHSAHRPSNTGNAFADARHLDGVCNTLEQQGVKLDGLQREFCGLRRDTALLRDEAAALQACLAASGLLSANNFQTELHRRRFHAVRLLHPLGFLGTTLEQILQHEGPGMRVAATIGVLGLHVLASASVAMSHMALELLQHLDRMMQVIVYVCGGYDGVRPCSSTERLGPPPRHSLTVPAQLHCGEWQAAPQMLVPRQQGAAATLRGRIFVCGGWDGSVALNTVECFDPHLGVWQAQPAMHERRDGAAATALANHVYVCGGRHTTEHSSAVRLDPDVGVWETLPAMRTARSRAAACSISAGVLICGGERGARNLACAEIFDPILGAWGQLAPMLESRAAHAAAVASGRVYVCGGWHDTRTLQSAEYFDPIAGSWLSLSPMAEQREGPAACAVAGDIYIFGGLDGWRPLSSVERLDTETGVWSRVAPMSQGRVYAAAGALRL